MICPSCQEELHPAQEVTQRFTTSYYCKSCKEESIVWDSIQSGDKAYQWGRYRIYCNYHDNTACVQRLYFDIESDTSILYRWATVVTLPKIPDNLSVENVEEKIKLYLLFS